MSHYRKMTVDDKDYRFNIGKKFVEIRDDVEKSKTLVPKTGIGIKSIYNEWIVKPKMIADYIRNGKVTSVENYFETCSCTGVDKTLGVKPYESEIEGKHEYVYWCEDCYDANADDI